MNKTKLVIGAIIIGLGVTMLSACDDDVPAQTQYVPAPQQQQVDEQYVNQQPPQVIQSAPAPVIVQSGSHDSGVGDFATGMILGHMMSGGGNNGGGYSNNSNRTTIINNNTVAQPRSSYSSNSRSSYSTNKQVYQSQPRSMSTQTYSRPTMNTNSSYTTKKSYSSPLSSSRSYSSSSSRKSYSSSRRR